MTKAINYTDAFFINEANHCVEWVYYNPDGNDVMGQFVINLFTFHNILVAAKDHAEPGLFFDHLGSVAKQTITDSYTKEYMEDYAYFHSAVDLTDCTKATMQALIDEVDYFQVFRLKRKLIGTEVYQEITNEQEQPPRKHTFLFPCEDAVNLTVYCIDAEEYHAYMLSSEY